MELGTPNATTAWRPWRRLQRVSGWMKGRRSRIDVVLSTALALLAALAPLTALGWWTAKHGSAGTWYYLSFALPQGWAMWVMAYTLLRPDLVGGSLEVAANREAAASREASVGRWLRWSTLFVLAVEQIPSLYYDHMLNLLEGSGWVVLLVGLELAGRAPVKLRQAVKRLESRKVLGPAERVEDLMSGLERTGQVWAVASGWCVAGALLATSPVALLRLIRQFDAGLPGETLGCLCPLLATSLATCHSGRQ